jgi:BASS family bile acid:Na+ symporter
MIFRIFKITVGVIIPITSLATGLRAALVDPFWLLKRPALLLRSLLAILILVPLGTFLFLEGLRPPELVEAGLLVTIVSIGIGPPAIFKQTRAAVADISYEIELNVILLLLAVVFIPTVVTVVGRYFHRELYLGASAVGKLVLTRSLIPLVIGIGVARLLPRVARPLGRIAGPLVQIVLLALIVVALAATWRGLFDLGARGWLLCAAVATGALAIGHLCGGREAAQRRVLATFSAMRFPGLALLIASVIPAGKKVIPVVLAYTLCSAVCLAIYGALLNRRQRRPAGRTIPSGHTAARRA